MDRIHAHDAQALARQACQVGQQLAGPAMGLEAGSGPQVMGAKGLAHLGADLEGLRAYAGSHPGQQFLWRLMSYICCSLLRFINKAFTLK